MNKLSVVISTYNRVDRLTMCLKSVKDLADEIIVVDNESTDNTVQVAKKFGAKVFVRRNNLMLNVNKNYGFTKAIGKWILCLDDDEQIPVELSNEIKNVLMSNQSFVGFWIPRRNIIFGKWIQHGIWWPDKQLRLFKRGLGKYPEKHVHEYINVEGQVGELKHAFVHYNYDSVSQYLSKMHHIYTQSEVDKFISSGYVISWRDAIRFPVSDFIKLYFAQSGYKDGLHGLVLSLLQAFYSFLIFVKLWERSNFMNIDISSDAAFGQLTQSGREFLYWVRTSKIAEEKNVFTRLKQKILRKYEKNRNHNS